MPRRIAYFIPLLIGLGLIITIAAAVYSDGEHYSQKARLEVFYKLSTVRSSLENSLNARLQLAKAIKSFIMHTPTVDETTFSGFTDRLLSDVSGVRRVLYAVNNEITLVYPAREASKTIGLNLKRDFMRTIRDLAVRVEKTRKPQLSQPVKTSEFSRLIVSATPVPLPAENNSGQQWGVVLVFMDADSLMRDIKDGQGAASLDVALREPGERPGSSIMLHGKGRVFTMAPVIMNIPIPGNYWQVGAVPAGGWPDSPNRNMIMYGGGAAAATATFLLFTLVFLLLKGIREREKYRYLIQNAKSIIIRFDLSAHITFSNEYADRFFGFEPGELVGRPLVGTILPEKSLEGEPSKRLINRMLDNPDMHIFHENICTRKNGELVWVSWANRAVRDRDGNTVEMLSVGTDITDRKIMEDARKQSERQYRLLAENVTDIILGLDADRRYTFVSPSDEALRGFPRYETLGRHISDFLTPQSTRIFDDATDDLISRITIGELPPTATLDLEFLCSDDTTVWLETQFGLLLNDDAELIGMQGVARDISDRKRAEMLRDDMERIVKHDLKTPLGAVVGLPGEIRRMGPLSSVQTDMLATIEDAGENMLSLINRSLDLFKMESGSYHLYRTPVNVLATVEAIKNETRAIIREKGISVGIEIPEGTEDKPFTINVEEPLFRSMIANLVLNALQASPDGGAVTISLSSDPMTTITIRNQGEVPMDMREIFFEKYTSSRNGGGTGLGTYSARLIARTHGGDITVDTSVPDETSVTVTLPV
ncbi:PAS domain S-box protein [Pseudodesulfovibrio sp. zrk46]|uniref:PAS domain S-box protein n=1 Tax=Pseudodesulfovibrio sp. zrk46 TaxID=2725288 RepID=UPI001448C719|nr:PAS domain S-box protein [Pseudodesulfovibrio sp. zrk46]QJB55611.1 PAS domain S-box protein [Pseudodesulfovibrio sp. zrk46]